jgi:hypothetical protein
MSILTQMPTALYVDDALDRFRATNAFDLGTAQALIWLSQLAYETDLDKIKTICGNLKIDLVGDPIQCNVKTALPIASTYVMVFDLQGTSIIAFAGTDPAQLVNWVTDFDIRPTDGGAAEGFSIATQVVEQKILARVPTEAPIMVTGHSLGGALAVVLAQWLVTMRRNVTAVYTFGMPRPGRHPFTDPYNQSDLAKHTYRLVHGNDIVPTVAPSQPLGFCHVGNYLWAPSSGKFSASAELVVTDKPDFVNGIAKELSGFIDDPAAQLSVYGAQLQRAASALSGAPDPQTRTDPVGIGIELLPPRLRDHMTDRYIAACSA